MDCSTPGFPVLHQLLELTQTHVHWVGDAIQPSHPLSSLLLLPSIFPSIRLFSNESVFHIRGPKYRSFSFSISLSNEYSRLICFRMDWLDLLAVQGTLKSLLHNHSSKAWKPSKSPTWKSQTYCSIQTLSWLNETHQHRKTIHFMSSTKLNVTHSLNTFIEILRIMFHQLSGCPIAHSNWYIKLTIADVLRV